MPLGGPGGWQPDGGLVRQPQGRRSLLRHGPRWLGSALGAPLEGTPLSVKIWPDPAERDEPLWRVRLEFALLVIVGALGTLSLIVFALTGIAASAHPGGLAADGCHTDRKNGGRHCHGGSDSRSVPPKAQPFASGETTSFANCREARAAGAAPVRRGDPGYSPRLDRDGDGIGCE
jgi:hypothetical protein